MKSASASGGAAASLLTAITIFFFYQDGGKQKRTFLSSTLQSRSYEFTVFLDAVIQAAESLGFSERSVREGDIFVQPKPANGKPVCPAGDGLFEGKVDLAPQENVGKCVVVNLGETTPEEVVRSAPSTPPTNNVNVISPKEGESWWSRQLSSKNAVTGFVLVAMMSALAETLSDAFKALFGGVHVYLIYIAGILAVLHFFSEPILAFIKAVMGLQKVAQAATPAGATAAIRPGTGTSPQQLETELTPLTGKVGRGGRGGRRNR